MAPLVARCKPNKAGTRSSKTGCITCRIRKVKCDEQKPACQRCLSTGRKCDGYSTLPFSRDELRAASLVSLVSDPAFEDVTEKRHFQFFRQNTVPGTNCLLSSRFWDRIVLQACHTEPAIKHAVLALSSWHQSSHADDAARPRTRVHADHQYQLALVDAQTLLRSASTIDLDRVLIACIVFSIFEAARGYHIASQQHFNHGHRIVLEYNSTLKTSRRSETAEILQTLSRVDVAFADQSPRNQLTLGDDHVRLWDFAEFRDAQGSLFDISHRVMYLQQRTYDAYVARDDQVYTKHQAERFKCLPLLLVWKDCFDRLLSRQSIRIDDLGVLFLMLSYNFSLIFAQTEDRAPETQFDSFLPQFEVIVACGEQIVDRLLRSPPQQSMISYDTGYLPCVFFTATRCREPRLRRRALSTLQALPRQEGIWKSSSVAKIAEQIIATEESGLGAKDVEFAQAVPEHQRIWQMDAHFGPDAASITGQFCGHAPGSSVVEFADS